MPKNYIQKFRMQNNVLHIPMSKLNDMVDAINYLQRGVLDRNHGRCYVRNMTGVDIDTEFAVLGINDAVFDPETDKSNFNLYPTFEGITPVVPTHYGKFVVAKEPIKNNAIVECVIYGAVTCTVNVIDTTHMFADITNGSSAYLTSSGTGTARILWKESGTGQKVAIVLLNVHAGIPCYKTTSTPSAGTIPAKLVNDSGAVVGTAETFIAWSSGV